MKESLPLSYESVVRELPNGGCELECYVILDKNRNAIAQAQCNAEDLVKRVNEYEGRELAIKALDEENDQLVEEVGNLRNDLDKQITLNRELVKELKETREFLNLEDFECGCDGYNGYECGLCRRKNNIDVLLIKLESEEIE